MLWRNTPYDSIIYMLRLLENDRKTSFLSDLFSRSRYMKRVQPFNGRYTKGISFIKNSIFKGKALDLGAKPLRTKLYWVASQPPSPSPFSLELSTSCSPTFWQLVALLSSGCKLPGVRLLSVINMTEKVPTRFNVQTPFTNFWTAKNLHGSAFSLHATHGTVKFLSCKQYCNLWRARSL